MILGSVVLEQSALHLFFFVAPRNVDGLHRPRVNARIIHTGGYTARSGVKVLNLFGVQVLFVKIFREFYRVFECAPGVGGHQVRNRVLLFAEFFVYFVKLIDKTFVYAVFGLAHIVQNIVRYMLGSNSELTAYVVTAKLVKKAFVLVRKQIVKANTRTDKDFFHLWQGAELTQKLQIIAVRNLHVLAWRGIKTLAALAYTVFKLFLARRRAKICGRSADIVNISLKVGHLSHSLCLAQYGRVTSRGDRPALMKGQRAETASAETAAAGGYAEFYFVYRGYAAVLFVGRVISPLVWKLVNLVKLRGRERG